MKKTILILSLLALANNMTGCVMNPANPTDVQPVQVRYVQACAAYGAAFAGALELRKAGKLDAVQVSQVSLIKNQITPICTGALPQDTDDAVQQITAAVTALTIMEAAK
jgi:hypothetical protein